MDAEAHVRDRPVILTFAGHYLPGFRAGGPVRTLANLVDRLGDTFDFRIVAADRDLGDASPFADIPINRWVERGRARVFYRSSGSTGWPALLASPDVVEPDLIYLNGFFGLHSAIRPLVERRLGRLSRAPVLLAPRGEFSDGALALKAIKKRAFMGLSRFVGLHRSVAFQASSSYEADDIRRRLGPVPVSVACDLSARSQTVLSPNSERLHCTPLRLVFLARISPMKNLLGAIDILSRVGATPVDFDIYGVMEDTAYWARCEAAMAALPTNVRVRYKGPLRPDEVETVLANYDAFLFPTLGENYGHVIREALSAGLPVLVSDRTPWRGLEAKGAGADLPLEAPQAFADRLQSWAKLDASALQPMREAARRVGDDPVAAKAALDANREMFLAALRRPG